LRRDERELWMDSLWTADITNDPARDFALCVEIYQGRRHRATIERCSLGKVVIRIFASEEVTEIPAMWFAEILDRAERELPFESSSD
jgi:hypothetical protein